MKMVKYTLKSSKVVIWVWQ